MSEFKKTNSKLDFDYSFNSKLQFKTLNSSKLIVELYNNVI